MIDKSQHVRELCRKLKPILGPQAERIWLLYLAEDEEGKRQVEEYVELLANQHLSGSLDEEKINLLPPEQMQADGDYRIGHIVYNNQSLYPFGLQGTEFIQHVGIYGRSGSGKTNIGLLIVQQLQGHGKPFLIFDWKRNYRDLLTLKGFENLRIYTIGRDVAPLKFNPLIPPDPDEPKAWLKKVISVIAYSYGLGNGVIYLLQEFMDQIFHDFGVYDGPVERWPTLSDVYEYAKRYKAQGRQAGWLASALRALASLCFGEMDRLLNYGQDDLDELFQQPVALELDALTHSDKIFVSSLLLAWLHNKRMIGGKRETHNLTILIEESHHLLSNEKTNLLGGQTVMDIVFREIREFGVSIINIDQMPSQINQAALANTYASICFNLKHKSDVNAMSQAMLLRDEEKDALGTLPVGQAIVKLQGRIPRPFLIQVPEFHIQKGRISDQDVINHMNRLGVMPRKEVIPDIPQAVEARSDSSRDDLIITFLKDIQTFPESGIASRYKRLALSVRQGQKLKEKLVGEGLIVETAEVTPQGKRRKVDLTEKGTSKI
jgi:predicted transcriptional regulator